MKQLLVISLLLINVFSYGEKDTLYFDQYWFESSQENATYYRVSKKTSDRKYEVKDYYINGQLQMSTITKSYKKIIKTGKTRFYYENGVLESEGDYENDVKVGEWKYWYEDEQLKRIGEESRNGKQGIWKKYYKNGSIESEGLYFNGKNRSEWKFWYKNGQLESKGVYNEGGRVGVWNFWHKNGQLESEGKYNDEGKVSLWNGYHENGKKKFIKNYNVENQLDGKVTFWHDNGQLSSETIYVNDKVVEGGKTFHKNGNVNLVFDNNNEGERIGDWIQYFDTGKLQIKGSFKSDEKNGEWIEYNSIGHIINKGAYKNNEKKGAWEYYSDNGVLKAVITYKEGDIITERYIDSNNKKVKSKEANKDPNYIAADNHQLVEQINLNFNLRNDDVVAGKSLISFIIDSEGTIVKVYANESINPLIDSNLVAAFKALGSFTPGKKYNRNIKSYADIELRLNENNTIDIIGEHYIVSDDSDIDFKSYNDYDEVFTIVDQMPEFPGGQGELFKFLGGNTRYPTLARKNSISGKVYVNFTVRRTGIISNVKIIRGVHKILDDEAIRVVKQMPKWIPGYQRGTPVSVSYNLPINFILK